MNTTRLISAITLTIGLLASATGIFAHGPGTGPDTSVGGLMVTRHFTGSWEQVDQESQGLSLEVIAQLDGSRRSVVYWYTYGADRKTAWYLGIGDLVEDRIELELFESTDVGFMQAADPDNDPVQSIGTMTIVFDTCDSGEVTYQTGHEGIGSGLFEIRRVSEVLNTHCSGGISDDMHADSVFGVQRIELLPARDGISGSGHARYEDYPGHMELDIEAEGVTDGDYHVFVGMQDRGGMEIVDGHGKLEFRSPAETGTMMMSFDPRGVPVEIHDNQGVVLSSFEESFHRQEHGYRGEGQDDHHYDCESGSGHGMGGGMGGGMHDCVYDGEFIEIETDLVNTGVLSGAKGEAEWNMNSERVEFSVEIEDIPVGYYTLKVGGVEEGIIEAFEMHNGEIYGHIRFRDPETSNREPLDFEPRGQKIEVFEGDSAILEVDFPVE